MISMFRRLFPCRFNEPHCQDSSWGCRCGKKGGSKKAEQRADDLARQQTAQAVATQQAIEAKTAPTSQEQARINQTFGLEAAQQPFLEARARATPEDLYRQIGPIAAQYSQGVQQRAGQTPAELFAGISPEAAQLAQYISQRFGMSPEDLLGGISPAAAGLQRAVTQDVNAPPTIPYESITGPEFQLIQEQINNEAARRGFGSGSGLTFEKLGKAGVNLAIRQAGLRQQNAQINQALRQQALENASQLSQAQYGLKSEAAGQQEGLVQSQQSLAEQAREQALGVSEAGANLSSQARNELASYLANLQNLSEAARGRQTQGVVQSYTAAEPFQARAGQSQQASLTALQNRVNQSREDVQGIGKMLASAAAVAAAPFTGGTSLMALPVIGNYGSSGGSQPLFGGGGYQYPGSSSSLLAGVRQANAAQQPFYGGGYDIALQQDPQLAQVYGQYPQRRRLFGGGWTSQ